MGDELCRLHPYQEVRNGGKLDTVHIFRKSLFFFQPGPIQQQASGAL